MKYFAARLFHFPFILCETQERWMYTIELDSHEIWLGLCDFPESLDELSEMVLPLFTPVENKSVDIPYWSEGPYGPEHIKVCVCVHHIVQLLYWLLPVINKIHGLYVHCRKYFTLCLWRIYGTCPCHGRYQTCLTTTPQM